MANSISELVKGDSIYVVKIWSQNREGIYREVTKVGRDYIHTIGTKFSKKDLTDANYVAYLSEDHFKQHLRIESLKAKIKRAFDFSSQVTEEQVLKIAEILDITNEN